MSEANKKNRRISRRVLMKATGATLIGGAAAGSALAQTAATASGQRVQARSPLSWAQTLHLAGDTGHAIAPFMDRVYGLQHAKYKKQMGWAVQVNPHGYSSVGTTSVHSAQISVDGNPVDMSGVVIVFYNTAFQISQLKELEGNRWWIFDWATLFVPGTLAPGPHEIIVRLLNANGRSVGNGPIIENFTLKASPQIEDIDHLCL